MMYYFWRHHGIFPSDIMARSAGEKMVLRAFFELEVEDRKAALKQYGEKAMPVVDITEL